MKVPKPKPATRRTRPSSAELTSPDGKPIIAFSDSKKLLHWLERHHVAHTGFWMRIFKKDSGRATVTYAQALDAALCYGWIDGQRRRGDAESFLQRFTPRGRRSVWSKVNTGHVERLTREGLMQPAGLAVVEAAKADGRWDAAYASSSTFQMPAEFTEALTAAPKATAFFATLSKANRFAIFYRLTTAKRPETKTRRLRDIIAMLTRGEKLH
jgi:uncharacterized protein YdeI (YjbR/CyaY-like superfamily)